MKNEENIFEYYLRIFGDRIDCLYNANNISKNKSLHFKNVKIKKKSQGYRDLYIPSNELSDVLSYVRLILNNLYIPPKSTFGFINNKSIIDNAKCHIGYKYLLNIDLKDFYYSFSKDRFIKSLKNEPFCFNAIVIKQLAELCFIEYEKRVFLPQGFQTSPVISNILMKDFDLETYNLSKKYKINFTRYVDDISFTSNEESSFIDNSDFLKDLDRILCKYNLVINPKKRRLVKNTKAQIVTGLVVNKKLNVKKSFIDSIKQYIYLWDRYGYDKANSIYYKNSDFRNNNLKDALLGKISFYKLVVGDNNKQYIKLIDKYNSLHQNYKLNNNFIDEFSKIEDYTYYINDSDDVNGENERDSSDVTEKPDFAKGDIYENGIHNAQYPNSVEEVKAGDNVDYVKVLSGSKFFFVAVSNNRVIAVLSNKEVSKMIPENELKYINELISSDITKAQLQGKEDFNYNQNSVFLNGKVKHIDTLNFNYNRKALFTAPINELLDKVMSWLFPNPDNKARIRNKDIFIMNKVKGSYFKGVPYIEIETESQAGGRQRFFMKMQPRPINKEDKHFKSLRSLYDILVVMDSIIPNFKYGNLLFNKAIKLFSSEFKAEGYNVVESGNVVTKDQLEKVIKMTISDEQYNSFRENARKVIPLFYGVENKPVVITEQEFNDKWKNKKDDTTTYSFKKIEDTDKGNLIKIVDGKRDTSDFVKEPGLTSGKGEAQKLWSTLAKANEFINGRKFRTYKKIKDSNKYKESISGKSLFASSESLTEYKKVLINFAASHLGKKLKWLTYQKTEQLEELILKPELLDKVIPRLAELGIEPTRNGVVEYLERLKEQASESTPTLEDLEYVVGDSRFNDNGEYNVDSEGNYIRLPLLMNSIKVNGRIVLKGINDHVLTNQEDVDALNNVLRTNLSSITPASVSIEVDESSMIKIEETKDIDSAFDGIIESEGPDFIA